MYRAIVLVTVFLVAVGADSDDDLKKCKRLLHPKSHHCCKKNSPLSNHPPLHDHIMEHSDLKECMQLPGNSCEREICMASKKGIASSDGKINKEALQNMLDEGLAHNPELLKLIKDNCVNGDISKFGKPDMCDLLKLKICMDIQFVSSCPEWDNEGECEGLDELAKECIEKFA